MNHHYSKTWYPPMPVLKIRLGYPEENLSLGPYTAIVDTAAMVPSCQSASLTVWKLPS